jgi:hypothetical protein
MNKLDLTGDTAFKELVARTKVTIRRYKSLENIFFVVIFSLYIYAFKLLLDISTVIGENTFMGVTLAAMGLAGFLLVKLLVMVKTR